MENAGSEEAGQYGRALGVRVVRGGAVVGASVVAWVVLWAVGASAVATASVFVPTLASQPPVESALQVGRYMQWVYAAASLVLVVGVLVHGRRWVRVVGLIWVAACLVLAVSGHIAFGDGTILAGVVGLGVNTLVLLWLWHSARERAV